MRFGDIQSQSTFLSPMQSPWLSDVSVGILRPARAAVSLGQHAFQIRRWNLALKVQCRNILAELGMCVPVNLGGVGVLGVRVAGHHIQRRMLKMMSWHSDWIQSAEAKPTRMADHRYGSKRSPDPPILDFPGLRNMGGFSYYLLKSQQLDPPILRQPGKSPIGGSGDRFEPNRWSAIQRRSRPHAAHFRSKTLPGALGGADLRGPDEGFCLEGTPKPKIQRDPSPPKGNLGCGPPLYG